MDGQPHAAMVGWVLFGLLSFILVRLWPALSLPAQALALAVLALLPRPAGVPAQRIQASLFLLVLGVLFLNLERARRQAGRSEQDRQQLAQQLDRRINQLFSLQELSYVLSESLQLERIAEQVTRYAQRFLQSEGAVLALVTGQGAELRVTAAEGSLRHLQGQAIAEDEATLIMQAIRHERIELVQAEGGMPVELLAGAKVRSAAAAPLRAHGFTMGALAVADRRNGPFTTEDLWLLSTVTTHVAVVLANSRLFEMIRQSKEEWETTFDALAEGIAVVDGTGKVRRANRALARLIDIPAPAMIGQPFWEIVIGGAESMAGLMEAAARGERQPPVLVRSDAINRILRLTAAPLSEPTEGTAVVVLVEDVTEQRALETKLIQNEKLAAVGQLVSGVAHELNNPLTSIAGLSEFLLERPPIPAPEREHLRVIHEQAERASRIVQNLLTFARKGAPETTTVDLNDVVARTAVLIAYELKLRGIALEQHLSSVPVTIRGDRYELQQVLLNLLTNAAQAAEGREGAPPRVMIETAHEEGQAVVRIRDNGPGVPLHLVPQLFTPFFTTKEPGEGTGLGLSISYGIVESHGGKLLYARAQDGGSEFTITLPYHGPSAEDSSEAAPGEKPPAVQARRRWILLVDDDLGVQRMVVALFAREGYRVEAARNGEHALELVRNRRYDLVIADHRAAAASGRRFVEALREQWPDAVGRLLVATAEADGATGDEWRQLGARVARKPFNLRELQEEAEKVLAV